MAVVNGKSGTFNIYTNNTSISGYVKWQETYDNATYTTTNKTTVTLTAYLHRTNIYSGQTWFDGGTVTRTAYFGSETVTNTSVQNMSVAGSSSNGTPTSGGGAFTQVYTASKEITHDSDGNKSISLGFAMSNNVTGVAGNSFTVPKTTATVSLTTVPRATTPTLSATTITMGSSITVTMTPAASTFKHKLRYDFGGIQGAAEGISVGWDFTAQGNSSVTFTPPTSLGSQIPSAMSGTGTLICYTYAADGTHIGTKTVGITLNVPAYTPAISGITLTGKNLLSSTYVQGKSTVTVNATLTTSYGATAKSVSAVIDGKTYTSLPFTTSVLSSGSKSAAITFTDSRNKSVTVTSSAITVYAYSIPSITAFTLARQTDGTTVIATVKGTIASVNSKNAKTIKVTLNGVTNTITSSSYTISGTTTFTGVSTDSTFNATASFADSYTTVTKQATLPTVAVTMDFHRSGTGIAMGKVSEKANLLDVAWPLKACGFKSSRGTRVKSADISPEEMYLGTMEFYLASSAMTSGKPSPVDGKTNPDGFIVHLHWDNTLGYDSQIFMENTKGTLLTRGCKAGVWNPWKRMLDTDLCKDYIVEQGESGGWIFRKWNSGVAECFIRHTFKPYASGDNDVTIAYPLTFTTNPTVNATLELNGTIAPGGVIACNAAGNTPNFETQCNLCVRGVTSTVYNIVLDIRVIGKWK